MNNGNELTSFSSYKVVEENTDKEAIFVKNITKLTVWIKNYFSFYFL